MLRPDWSLRIGEDFWSGHLVGGIGQSGEDPADADALLERYAERLLDFTSEQLESDLRPKLDPEDVVQSTLRSFYRRHKRGEFELTSWGSLWYLLAQIARRKCFRAERFYGADKRDHRREIRCDSAVEESSLQDWQTEWRQPKIEDVVALRDTVAWVMESLEPMQQRIVSLHLEGHDSREIADAVTRSQRTVRRTLQLVRDAIQQQHSELGIKMPQQSD